jgi:hypothetical protein
METPKFVKGDRVFIVSVNAYGTIYNIRNNDESGGILYTITLDTPFYPDQPFFYAREFELEESYTLKQLRGQFQDEDPSEFEE